MSRSWGLTCVVLLGLLAAGPALALDDPEVGLTAPAQKGGAARRKVGSKRTAARASAASKPTAEPPPDDAVEISPAMPEQVGAEVEGSEAWTPDPNGSSSEEPGGECDHDAVVGRFGVGLLGLADVAVGVGDPIGGGGDLRTTTSPLSLPILGLRYWLTSRFGVDVGLGFGFSGGTINITGQTEADNASLRAVAGHAGVPISLKAGAHYNLIAVPYVGIGFSRATDTRGTSANTDDVFGKGLTFEAGLKGGVEVQLGSIGLSGFALQITGGLRLRHESTSANIPVLTATGAAATTSDIEVSSLSFGTSTGSTLGRLVGGAIAALYYF